MKFLREYVHPVLVGGIPMLIGCLAVGPMMIYWIFAKALPILLPIPSLIFLYLWARLGYRFAVNCGGWKHLFLIHAIPFFASLLSVHQLLLPGDAANEILENISLIAVFPALNLALTLNALNFDTIVVMVLSLMFMIAAYCVGMMLGNRKRTNVAI